MINHYINNIDTLRLVFLIIEFLNIGVFIYAGLKIMRLKDERRYWNYAIWPIISYCICRGLRFGRGIDYNAYFEVYNLIGNNFGDSTNHELLFKCINWLMYQLGLPYQAFIFSCSFFLIFIVTLIIKDYKKAAPFILLFFLYETRNATIYIRWYLGFCFFFLSYLSLIKKQKFLFIFYTICAVLTHMGTILLTPLLLFFNNHKRPLCSYKIILILFIVSVTMGGVHLLNGLIPYLELISMVSERSQGYTDRFEDLIGGYWGTGINEFSIIASIRILFSYIFPIIYAPLIAIKYFKNDYIPLNFFYIGAVVLPIFNSIELFDRYSMAFMFFSIFVSGISYYHGLKYYKSLSSLFRLLCIAGLTANLYAVVSEILHLSRYWFNMLFIWDAGNLDCLPIWVFHMYD